MYVSTHIVVGAVIGKVTGNVPLAFAAGLISHGVLDAVPHHDYKRAGPGVVDFLIGLFLLYYLFSIEFSGPALAGALGGALPDLEVAISYLSGKIRNIFPSHTGLTPHNNSHTIFGITLQIIIVILGLISYNML